MVVSFYGPANQVWGFQFPHILASICYCLPFFITVILVNKKWLIYLFLNSHICNGKGLVLLRCVSKNITSSVRGTLPLPLPRGKILLGLSFSSETFASLTREATVCLYHILDPLFSIILKNTKCIVMALRMTVAFISLSVGKYNVISQQNCLYLLREAVTKVEWVKFTQEWWQGGRQWEAYTTFR